LNGEFFRYHFNWIFLLWIFDDFNLVVVVLWCGCDWWGCHRSNLHPCFLSHLHSSRVHVVPGLIHLNLGNWFRNIFYTIIFILLLPFLLLILVWRRKSSIPTHLFLLILFLIFPLKLPLPLNLFTQLFVTVHIRVIFIRMERIVLVVPGPYIRSLVILPFLLSGILASETLSFEGSVETIDVIVCDVLLDFGDVLEE